MNRAPIDPLAAVFAGVLFLSSELAHDAIEATAVDRNGRTVRLTETLLALLLGMLIAAVALAVSNVRPAEQTPLIAIGAACAAAAIWLTSRSLRHALREQTRAPNPDPTGGTRRRRL